MTLLPGMACLPEMAWAQPVAAEGRTDGDWAFRRHQRGCMVIAQYDGRPSSTLVLARISAEPGRIYLLIHNSGRRVVAGKGQPLELSVDAVPAGTVVAQPRRWGDGLAYELALPPATAERVRSGRVLLVARRGVVIERLDLSGLAIAARRLEGCRG